VAARC